MVCLSLSISNPPTRNVVRHSVSNMYGPLFLRHIIHIWYKRYVTVKLLVVITSIVSQRGAICVCVCVCVGYVCMWGMYVSVCGCACVVCVRVFVCGLC